MLSACDTHERSQEPERHNPVNSMSSVENRVLEIPKQIPERVGLSPRFHETLPQRFRRLMLGAAYAVVPRRIALLPRLTLLSIAHLLAPASQRDRLPDHPIYYSKRGLVGISNDLSVNALLANYRRGYFPICHVGSMKWWSPEERAVIDPAATHVGKNLRRLLRQQKFKVTFDQDFAGVIEACAQPRSGKVPLTWITPRVMSEAKPLIVVALFTYFFADVDILIVTPLLTSAETAAVGLCLKLALLVGFAAQVAHQVVVPDLADARARKDRGPIRGVLARALAFPLAVTLAAMVVVVLWGELLLGIFGPEFVSAAPALTILMSCQLARAVFGPSVPLLTVIGAQRQNAALALAALAILGVSNLMLAPLYGVLGAAMAVAIATLFWLFASAIVLRRVSGLRTDAVYLIWPLPSRLGRGTSPGSLPGE
jgi:hypothetical protein